MALIIGKNIYCITLCAILMHILVDTEALELSQIGKGISKSFYDMFQKFKTPFIKDGGYSGGVSSESGKDDEIVSVIERAKAQLEEKTGKKYKSLEPVSYIIQEVAGTNYFAKVKATTEDGTESIIFMRVYENIQRQVRLDSYNLDKKLTDKLDYF